MVAVVATSALLVGAVSSPVFAVNDAFVPGEDCSPDLSQAVGHPAFAKEQLPVAGALFSANNPGASTDAKGSTHSEAPPTARTPSRRSAPYRAAHRAGALE